MRSPLPERPCLAAHFTVTERGEDHVELSSLTQSLSLRGRDGLPARLIQLLDGSRDIASVLAEVEPLPAGEAVRLLERLGAAGALEGTHNAKLSTTQHLRYAEQVAFLSNFGVPVTPERAREGTVASGAAFQARLCDSHVFVWGLGRIGARVATSLAAAGVGRLTVLDNERVSPADAACDSGYRPDHIGLLRREVAEALVIEANPDADVVGITRATAADAEREGLLSEVDFGIVAADTPDRARHDCMNEVALRTGVTWTSCRLNRLELWIGPTVVPKETACFHCFELRRLSNLSAAERELLTGEAPVVPPPRGLPMFAPGADLVAFEALKALTGLAQCPTLGRLLTLNLISFESELHEVLKVPRCAACGRPSLDRPTVALWDTEPLPSDGNGQSPSDESTT